MAPHPNCEPRTSALATAMAAAGLDALIVTHNLNVLLATGFWPVTGASVAIATRNGEVTLVVPEDAQGLAQRGWATPIHTYRTGDLASVDAPGATLCRTLARLLPTLVRARARVGIEGAIVHVPAAYVSQQSLAPLVADCLARAVPHATVAPADGLLQGLRARPTPWERERIRTACRIAEGAYAHGVTALRAGMAEAAAVLPFQHALAQAALAEPDVERADGRFFCMSGPNAAKASAAFQQSGRRPLGESEAVLVHCNSYVDGYWTDITRTYVLGECGARLRRMQDAIADARAAALEAIRPGAAASTVDQAARAVFAQSGLADAFRHPTGHGVGFAAIDHDAWPRIHPRSGDVLEEGMTFNVEPGLYFDGDCGLRDCNMVAVTATGCELLTPFHLAPADWRLPSIPDEPRTPS